MPEFAVEFDRDPPARAFDHVIWTLDRSLDPKSLPGFALPSIEAFLGGYAADMIESVEEFAADTTLDPEERARAESLLAQTREDVRTGGPWYPIEAGLMWIVQARSYVEAHPERFERWSNRETNELVEVRRELDELEAVLRTGLPHGARFQIVAY